MTINSIQMSQSYNSPSRPIPHFFNDHKWLTTKKERNTWTPNSKRVPPRPPSKSVPPVSRFFSAPNYQKAQAISFKDNSDSSLSKHYDESREESYFEQCFQVECKVGSGSFGDVFKVKSKEDGNYYAIKRSKERFKGKSDRERKLEEVCKHEKLPKHANCVRLYKAWEERQHLYIQTELCETSLSDFAETNHDIPERVVWNYLVDLLKAVRHLHDQHLIHLDIKPDNIFISSDGSCKLGDFGLVLDLNKNDANEATEGDPKYLAKELMQGIFTKAADIFSLGITILEIACDLDLPSGGEGWHRLRDGNIPDSVFKDISYELKCIIKSMMNPDFKSRPSAEELLNNSHICKIVRLRRLKLGIRKTLNYAKKLLYWFIAFFLNLIFHICYPIKQLYKRIKKKSTIIETPPHVLNNSRHSTEWESNYSDDDVFDNSNTSFIEPLVLDSSTSSDSRYTPNHNSFDSIRVGYDRQYCSTTVINRHRPILDDPLSSPSFKQSSPIQRFYISSVNDSPTLFKEPINRSKIISQRLNFDNHFDDDITEWDKSINIEPKNLLKHY